MQKVLKIRSLDDLKMYYNGYKMLKKDTQWVSLNITVWIPAYNEEKNIAEIVQKFNNKSD
jgi:hypothetical protein